MKLGVVGLPNVGKSTLFNAITNAGAESANYPFCTIEPNVGIVAVPDERLEVLTKMYNSKKTVNAVLEFVDIAGLVKGAALGEGLGNKFLSHIREVDAIVHVVRCFDDPNIIHVEGSIDPIRDIETINLELIYSDVESVKRRIDKTEKQARSGDKKAIAENEVLKKILPHLEGGSSVRTLPLTSEQRLMVDSFFLLSSKPVIYCANVSEAQINEENDYVKRVKSYAKNENSECIKLCAKIEEELAKLDTETKEEFIKELSLEGSGLQVMIKCGYRLLGLISYLTAGEKEVRAWTIQKGTKAPAAAGKIHSDFERGFIRAEVVSYSDLVEAKSIAAAREKGKLKSEGKDYVVADGDVINFRFNV